MANAKTLLVIGPATAVFVAASVWLFGYHGHIGIDGGPHTVGWVGLILFFPATRPHAAAWSFGQSRGPNAGHTDPGE